MRFVNYCIPFLFTICTVSQLFGNQVCTILVSLERIPFGLYYPSSRVDNAQKDKKFIETEVP